MVDPEKDEDDSKCKDAADSAVLAPGIWTCRVGRPALRLRGTKKKPRSQK